MKTDKECFECRRWPGIRQSRNVQCDECHGLGWFPAPGDSLTEKEAELLASDSDSNVQSRIPGDKWFGLWETYDVITVSDERGNWEFRVAPID